MKSSTVNYFIGDAFKSFKRNKTISIATIITVLVTFIVLGTFSLVAENLNLAIGGLEDKIELVEKNFHFKNFSLLFSKTSKIDCYLF